MNDTQADIFKILDDAGLSAATLLSGKKSMQTIVNQIRLKIAQDVAKYIEENYDK